MRLTDRRIAIAFGACAAFAYVASAIGETTAYDYYGRLARALLAGRWWLDEAPPWLNELLSCGDGRWCVAYPPLPAILAMPFALVLPTASAQVLVSQLAGGASSGFLYAGLRAFGAPRWVAITGTILSAFGTTLLLTAADGRVWFAAHAVAMLFLSAAFLVAARGGSAPWFGALIGLATLSRLPVAAATPALVLLLAHRAGAPYLRSLAGAAAGGLPFALIYLGYNLLRWGSPLDLGYTRLAEGDVFFDHGVFSLAYLPRHVVAIFLEPPDLVPGSSIVVRPRSIGTSLFLTTPALIWLFIGLREARRNVAVAAAAVAAGLALLPDVTHATVGFQQFGYRFSIDAQPFLIALAASGDALRHGVWRSRPSSPFLVAVAASVAVNIYAVVVVLHLGYWQ